MLFNSIQFIIFLPLVVLAYYALPVKLRWVLLLAASYAFYMFWKPEYIVLIIASTLVDYVAGIMMEKQSDKKKRRVFLLLSLVTNLGLLFVFKYFNFFNQEFGRIYTALTSQDYNFAGLRILLPMGISFYTFQTLSYSIDVYRGTRKAERHLGYFALYVTFFPQLVAGPIERSDRLLPQLKQKHKLTYQSFLDAMLKIAWGFFKKVVIADRVAVVVNTIYSDLPTYSGIYLIVATLGFAIQIYCDFSAYSDIAIGSAKLMGIDLMENFRTPYFAKSISEFWSRWHISLSTWFRDYLYIPLGGNRMEKQWKIYRNILIVFLVSGFWHGANWTFILWGALHGVVLVLERLWRTNSKKSLAPDRKFKLPSVVKQAYAFVVVLASWVLFRADSLADAFYVYKNVSFSQLSSFFGTNPLSIGLDMKEAVLLAVCVVGLFVVDGLATYGNKQKQKPNDWLQGIAIVGLLIFVLVFGYYGNYDAQAFIYFQF